MRSYRLSKLAEGDLAEILRYTIRTWGKEQAITYFQNLTEGRWRIVENPILLGSKDRADLARDCRTFRVAKHVFFYRVNGTCVEIARILHESMDFPQHLSDETFD